MVSRAHPKPFSFSTSITRFKLQWAPIGDKVRWVAGHRLAETSIAQKLYAMPKRRMIALRLHRLFVRSIFPPLNHLLRRIIRTIQTANHPNLSGSKKSSFIFHSLNDMIQTIRYSLHCRLFVSRTRELTSIYTFIYIFSNVVSGNVCKNKAIPSIIT